MSHSSPRQIDGPQSGFTIIEVLIALAVVAVGIVAVASVMSTNVHGVRSMERHMALMQAARRAMNTGIPPRAELASGVLSGQLDEHRWQIGIGELGGGWVVPDADIAWIPQLVKIHVQSSSGGSYDLQTIRLMHGQPRQ